MKRYLPVALILVFMMVGFGGVLADENEGGACPAIVETALQAADEFCVGIGRNQICYGNVLLDATAQDHANFAFEKIGDITDVLNLASLRVAPMDEETGEWGVAIARLQANLPDTLPGQNVTFIIFGDVELVNRVTPEQVESGEFSPMQSFYLTTGIGDARCRESPESGLLVQTPRGVGEVSFVLNEVEISMGSTVLFQAATSHNLDVTVLEGAAALRTERDATVYPVVAGMRFSMNITADDWRIVPVPELPEPYELARLEALPLSLLDRPIEIRQPLEKTEFDALIDRWEAGEALCGDEAGLLPACENLPAIAGGTPCVWPDADGNRPPDADPERPLCEASADDENADEDGST